MRLRLAEEQLGDRCELIRLIDVVIRRFGRIKGEVILVRTLDHIDVLVDRPGIVSQLADLSGAGIGRVAGLGRLQIPHSKRRVGLSPAPDFEGECVGGV